MKKILSLALALTMLLGMVAFAEDAKPTYTYNEAVTAFPTNWSPFSYQTSTDASIKDWLERGFYVFDYNETKDSYKIVPEAAVGELVDITSDYVGKKWNIPEFVLDKDGKPTEEKSKHLVWKVTLRSDLAWEDGTPIKAQDFVTSMQLLLNPKAKNHRADTVYSGNFKLIGAEAYLKGGVELDTSFRSLIKNLNINEKDDASSMAKLLEVYGDKKGYIDWKNSYGDSYDFEKKAWTGAAEAGVVETPLTVKELYEFFVSGEGAKFATWADEAQKKEWAFDELFAKYTAPEMPFDTVGIEALSDTELVYALDAPLSGFYLYYSLPAFLVHEELYNKLASEKDGVYTNSYGTSVETSKSWGPYRLSEFQSDKVYTLARNEKWYGYADPINEGRYQTTHIRTQLVKEAATRRQMFENGELDFYGLNKDDMQDYGKSQHTYYTEGDSVYAIALNPDLAALEANQKTAGENINKTILTLKDFRIAISAAMNRAEFALATNPVSRPAFALYGSQIVADPDNAVFYRDTDVAKKVVADFWGLSEEIGEGKMYADIDEAIESVSGYNLEMAKQHFDKAYDEAIAKGLMKEGDVVKIIIGTPNMTSVFYNNGYDFIVNNYTEAVKGTKLEGKLEFERDGTLGNGYADALRNNKVDMLFGVGWTGSTFDPYGLIEAYVKENYQYDKSWDTSKAMLEITLDGVKYKASVFEWFEVINAKVVPVTNVETGEKVNMTLPYSTVKEEADRRIYVLGQLENAILQNYHFIPLIGSYSAALKSMKVKYYTEDQIFPMGRGGIKYMTYNYDDAQWAAYVKEQGGTLNYK